MFYDDIITVDRDACTVTIHTDEIPGYQAGHVDESLWDRIRDDAVRAAGELAREMGRPAQIYDDDGYLLKQIDEPIDE